MMVLDKVKSYLQDLPNRRGLEAVKGYGLVTVVLFLTGGGLALLYNLIFLSGTLLPFGSQTNQQGVQPKESRDVPGPINGALFTATEAKTWANRRPLAVIIENHVDARPKSGLSSADLVYESLAEGGITRLVAFYLTNLSVVTLGPVRSMRIYFLDWLEEYDAAAVHVGGNAVAIGRIGPEKVKDIDQFYNGAYFDRVNDRPGPHNVYTNTERLWAAADKRGYGGAASFKSWPFKADAEVSARASQQVVKLGFLGDQNYKVAWTYDQTTNTYQRAVGGESDVDRNNNQQEAAKTLVVEVIPYRTGLSYPGDPAASMDDIGSGKVYIFQDGVTTEGTWNKKSRLERTTFMDKNNKEISFNRGPIWIEVIPPASPIEF